MSNRRLKKVCLFVISIPLTIGFNYFVTMHLLDYINYFGFKGYIISLFIQLFLWYEILVFFFDKLEKTDKYMITIIYYLLFLCCMFARPYQNEAIVNLNPLDIMNQFNNWHDIVIVIFNVSIFIPLITIHSFFVEKLKTNVLICVILSFVIEILQVIFHRGIFDICDILFYFIGIVIGVVVLRWFNSNKVR